MSIQLPKPIDVYFANENAHDATALDNCFTAQAIVRDEGKTIKGLPAIKAWRIETGRKLVTPFNHLLCRSAMGRLS